MLSAFAVRSLKTLASVSDSPLPLFFTPGDFVGPSTATVLYQYLLSTFTTTTTTLTGPTVSTLVQLFGTVHSLTHFSLALLLYGYFVPFFLSSSIVHEAIQKSRNGDGRCPQTQLQPKVVMMLRLVVQVSFNVLIPFCLEQVLRQSSRNTIFTNKSRKETNSWFSNKRNWRCDC